MHEGIAARAARRKDEHPSTMCEWRFEQTFALELQMEAAERQADAAEVKEAISVALRHMRSGKSRHRCGGQTLIRHLEVARLRAVEEDEWDIVRLLQDSLDYATGQILLPDFEERYRLFDRLLEPVTPRPKST